MNWYAALSQPPPVPPGTRIELTSMPNDPDPIPIGSTGTVLEGSNGHQLYVDWDNGRSLLLVVGIDHWRVIP